MAVPERAQVPDDTCSEAGQQEADADQGSKRGDKSHGSCRERRYRRRGKGGRGDICLAHGGDFQEMGLVLEVIDKGTSNCAVWRAFTCPICLRVSVAGGTHRRP